MGGSVAVNDHVKKPEMLGGGSGEDTDGEGKKEGETMARKDAKDGGDGEEEGCREGELPLVEKEDLAGILDL